MQRWAPARAFTLVFDGLCPGMTNADAAEIAQHDPTQAETVLKLTEYRFRGHQIQMPTTRILEECDVAVRSAAQNCTADQIIQIAAHVAFSDCSAGDRAQDIADAVEGRLTTVREND